MTQEYTPTDNDVKADYVRAFCSARNTKNWSENSVKGERAFNRWLAAHDAQIRAEALELTNEELDVAARAYEGLPRISLREVPVLDTKSREES